MPESPQSLNPPKQSRSRRTLERIVDASLELLATEGPDGLTVQAVVARAGSSVGSFYARFGGKADLLDYLGERVWDDALSRWNEALASRDWAELTTAELIEGAVGLIVDAQRSRSAYLRALDQAHGRGARAYDRFRDELLLGLADLLLKRRDDFEHEDAEVAVRLGLRAVMGLVEGESRTGEERLPREIIIAESARLLASYLLGEATGEPGEGVDFFDVWG